MTLDEAHDRIAAILGPSQTVTERGEACRRWLRDPAYPTGARIELDAVYGVCKGLVYLWATAPDGRCEGWDVTDTNDRDRLKLTPEDGAKDALAFIERHSLAKKELP